MGPHALPLPPQALSSPRYMPCMVFRRISIDRDSMYMYNVHI